MLGAIKRYRQFLVDSSSIAGAATLTKIVSLALVPVIARLYEPSDYGIMALVLSMAAIFGPVVALRYEQAVVLPDSDLVGYRLLQLGVILSLVTSSLLLGVCLLFLLAELDINYLNQFGFWLLVVPLFVLLYSFKGMLENWAARQRQFNVVGLSDVADTGSMNAVRIALGLFVGSSILGLIAGALAGVFARLWVLVRVAQWPSVDDSSARHEHALSSVAKQYSDFPKYSMPAGLLNVFFTKMPLVILGAFFSAASVGLYEMAQRLARLPVDVGALPIRKVYLQRISVLYNEQKSFVGMQIKLTLFLFGLGLIPFALVWLYGLELFGFFLGEKWSVAGEYASLLVPWLYTVFCVTPTTANFIVLKRQALWLRLQILNGLAGFSVLMCCVSVDMPITELLWNFAIVGMGVNVLTLLVSMSLSFRAVRG